jgi:hypothetical protein
MARHRIVNLCSRWTARVAGVALLLSASVAQASLITLDITGTASNSGLGGNDNAVLMFDLNQELGTAPGSRVTVTGIGWDVVISTLGLSWVSEALVQLQDSSGNGLLGLQPGAGQDRSGTERFSSDIVDLVGLGIGVVLDNGILILEFAEDFSDNDGTDAVWGPAATAATAFSALNDVPPQTSTLTLEVTVNGVGVPAPATSLLMLGGLGLLLTLRRRRRHA